MADLNATDLAPLFRLAQGTGENILVAVADDVAGINITGVDKKFAVYEETSVSWTICLHELEQTKPYFGYFQAKVKVFCPNAADSWMPKFGRQFPKCPHPLRGKVLRVGCLGTNFDE